MSKRWDEYNPFSAITVKNSLEAGETRLNFNPGYCSKDATTESTLPGTGKTKQIKFLNKPYGSPSCDQYSTLIKPGINPITLRGKSDTDKTVSNPVNDIDLVTETEGVYIIDDLKTNYGVCSEVGGFHDDIWYANQCSMWKPEYCSGNNCDNDAPGGLADWMGAPSTRFGKKWYESQDDQFSKSTKVVYKNPIQLKDPKLMKYGFVTDGCDCNGATKNIRNQLYEALPGIYDLAKTADVASEQWNGIGTCDSSNDWITGNTDSLMNTNCVANIEKYAKTCNWCKTAALLIPGSDRNNFCTVTNGVDNGDCLGFGVDGKPRNPCAVPTSTVFNCKRTGIPSTERIGLFCNVYARDRLDKACSAFANCQSLVFMTTGVGFSTGFRRVKYHDTTTTGNNITYSETITGIPSINNMAKISIGFPPGTVASRLMDNLILNYPTVFGLFNYNPVNGTPKYTIQYFDNITDTNANTSLANVPQNPSPGFTIEIRGNGSLQQFGSINFSNSNLIALGTMHLTIINGSPMNISVSGSLTNSITNPVITFTIPNETVTAQQVIDFFNNDPVIKASERMSASLAFNASGSTLQSSVEEYQFMQSCDKTIPTPSKVITSGNCDVRLDGTVYDPITSPNKPTNQNWLGKWGINCDIPIGQGQCKNWWYRPNDTDDCQICKSDLWNWIPGGYSAILDKSSNIHYLAKLAYIPKYQSSSGALNTSSVDSNVNNNSRSSRCSLGETMNWNTNSIPEITILDQTKTIIGESAVSNASPGKDCMTNNINGSSNSLCERNPVLTLRGDSDAENATLAINWINGVYQLGTIHGKSTGLSDSYRPDPRNNETENLDRRIKAMRCCLGLNPGFESVDNKNVVKLGPKDDPYGGKEMWGSIDCPPGLTCPSSDACKKLFKDIISGSDELKLDTGDFSQYSNIKMDLNDFASMSYPDYFVLDNITGNSFTSNILSTIQSTVAPGTYPKKEDMSNPAYYAKAYCELMSGASDPGSNTGNFGFDDSVNTICRKAMYKYCSSDVSVNVLPEKETEYISGTYKLPLNIYTEECFNWFKNDLAEVLPSDYGTRDMLLGSTCQKLQNDGWYSVEGPSSSEILSKFVDSSGHITDTSGRVLDLTHNGRFSSTNSSSITGLPGLLAQTCNCFLTGSKCYTTGSSSNCSYQYCSAGSNNKDITDTVINYGSSSSAGLNDIKGTVDLTKYTNLSGGDGSWTEFTDTGAPSWSRGINNSNFTCAGQTTTSPGSQISNVEPGLASNCYIGCNYVNEYDIAWNASPLNRKFSGEMLGSDNEWEINADGSPNSYSSGKYGVFGDCPVDSNGEPNCGTDSFFTEKMGLSPKEVKKKNMYNPNRSNITNTPLWQNIYSAGKSIHIDGWGTVDDSKNKGVFSNNICATNGIRPYNTSPVATKSCNISQTTAFNNQGTISGNVGISQLAECNFSNGLFNGDTTNVQKIAFLKYLGDKNNCSNIDCYNKSNFCLTTTTNSDSLNGDVYMGENCMYCGTPPNDYNGLGGDISNPISSPDKPHTCCLSPSVNTSEVAANTNLINAVSPGSDPVISYICGPDTTGSSRSCPTGSTNLSDLESSCGTGFKCSDNTTQSSCKGCDFCSWVNNYDGSGNVSGKKCIARCPVSASSGWEVGITEPPTVEPTEEPTEEPDSGGGSGGGSGGSTSNLTGSIAGGVVGGISVIFILIIIALYKYDVRGFKAFIKKFIS